MRKLAERIYDFWCDVAMIVCPPLFIAGLFGLVYLMFIFIKFITNVK